jgi:hypothetical protein
MQEFRFQLAGCYLPPFGIISCPIHQLLWSDICLWCCHICSVFVEKSFAGRCSTSSGSSRCWCTFLYILKMEGLSKCRDGRCSPSECHLTNTNLSVRSQATPKYFSPYGLQIFNIAPFMNNALSYMSCLQPLMRIYSLATLIYIISLLPS